MVEDKLRYDRMLERALRGVVREALAHTAEHGLSGDHHFYLTFTTGFPGVVIPEHLRQRYPEEMTIVIQHWYDGLEVDDDGFGITLNFGDSPERLRIPFDAILTFVDPSVEFGLRFETAPAPDGPDDGPAPEDDDDGETPTERSGKDAEVVSLDTFRRNH